MILLSWFMLMLMLRSIVDEAREVRNCGSLAQFNFRRIPCLIFSNFTPIFWKQKWVNLHLDFRWYFLTLIEYMPWTNCNDDETVLETMMKVVIPNLYGMPWWHVTMIAMIIKLLMMIVLNVFRSCYLNKLFCKFWIYFSKYYRPLGSWSALVKSTSLKMSTGENRK